MPVFILKEGHALWHVKFFVDNYNPYFNGFVERDTLKSWVGFRNLLKDFR